MDNKEIKILNIDDVLPNRFQPRIQFDEKAINELANSIKVHGVIQPIVVRRISDKYEIIAGERRYKASVLAGKKEIPAIITEFDDKESAEIALIENVQRQNLTPIEEAISYKKILDMGYLNQITLGEKLGKTQSTIANKLRLLNLNDDVQQALMEGKISERHARSLLRLSDNLQPIMLSRIINERLTVRKTDEEIEKMLNENPTGNEFKIEGEQIMNNNDILKDIGIPTEPIVEDKTNNVVSSLETLDFDLPSIDQVTPEVTSTSETKPMESLDEMFKSFAEPKVNNIEPATEEIGSYKYDIPVDTPKEEVPFRDINPGFMDVDKIASTATDVYKEPEPVADIDKLMDTSNNPVIEQSVSPMQEVPVQSMEQPTAPSGVPGGKFFTMFAKEEDTNPNFVKDIESKEVNMDFETPTPEPTFNFNPVTFERPETNEDTNKIQSDSGFSINQPVEQQPDLDKTIDFTQTFTPFSLNDEDAFTKEKEEKPFQPYAQPEPITYDEMGEIKVKLPEQQRLATADLKTVINTIRECAATIERFGFTIDTEEIDLADSYQVTFTIDKN